MTMSPASLRIEHMDPKVVEILRTKTPTERCEMAFEANRLVRERLRGHLQYEHPDWDERQIKTEVLRRILANDVAQWADTIQVTDLLAAVSQRHSNEDVSGITA